MTDTNKYNYFENDNYWKEHADLPLEEDFWIDDYRDQFTKGKNALDLGCGIGQYTRRLTEYGYNVLSADISDTALARVKEFNPRTAKIDMRRPLPFEDKKFDLVFANLSIHYFSNTETKNLISEIIRILNDDGIFVGSVNGMQGLPYIKDTSVELEHHFYQTSDRYIRLFDADDLKYFLSPFSSLAIEERSTVRFGSPKTYLVFISKK